MAANSIERDGPDIVITISKRKQAVTGRAPMPCKYVPAPSRVPVCFMSANQYAEWKAMAKKTMIGEESICVDCTPEYQARMKQQDRCRYPDTWFSADDEGMVIGHRRQARRVGRRKEYNALFAAGETVPA